MGCTDWIIGPLGYGD